MYEFLYSALTCRSKYSPALFQLSRRWFTWCITK